MANILNTSIRKEIDIPCRYSGKQFGILLPNTDVDGAYVLGERIRQRCEKQVFSTSQGIPVKITMSIGIAHNIEVAHEEVLQQNTNQPPVTQISKEELMCRADLMLHAAKQAGCNQVMVWW